MRAPRLRPAACCPSHRDGTDVTACLCVACAELLAGDALLGPSLELEEALPALRRRLGRLDPVPPASVALVLPDRVGRYLLAAAGCADGLDAPSPGERWAVAILVACGFDHGVVVAQDPAPLLALAHLALADVACGEPSPLLAQVAALAMASVSPRDAIDVAIAACSGRAPTTAPAAPPPD